MNINEAKNATLATFITELMDGQVDSMSKGDVAIHVLDLMADHLNRQQWN